MHTFLPFPFPYLYTFHPQQYIFSQGIFTHAKCYFNTYSYVYFRRLLTFVLTTFYRNKDARVPSQHQRCNYCSSVVVENMVIVVTPSVVTLVVSATLDVATLTIDRCYNSHQIPLLQLHNISSIKHAYVTKDRPIN
jgi:hypothetical protein